ncbi:MAG: class II aldolase/adducin family protein [Alphaproteobacteria bacterium]|nr:MAG: class II aldolase/adducin family protein [Alphaproteobacteria bacterium]
MLASRLSLALGPRVSSTTRRDLSARLGKGRHFRFAPAHRSLLFQSRKAVPDNLSDARYEVALANRILANEGVLDAFGHVSLRHPSDPSRYLLSRSRSPGLIEPDDVLEFTLDSEPVATPSVQLYAERVIHGCIYEARPDVTAVCHHHAPSVMPFCIAGVPIVPVFIWGLPGVKRCRSGISATSSATRICWWSSRRRAARSLARSDRTARCS